MRFFGKRSRCKSGVGSIVGAVFVLLIILSGFTFYSLYLTVMDHYNQTLGSMGDFDWDRGREKLVIKQIRTTGGSQLNVTVENQGTLPCHLVWFGIFNKTAVPENQAYYALDMSIDPAEVQSVVSGFTIVMGKKHVIQLVTELGNRFESKFYPASEVRCALSLTVTPPTVYVGNNITAMLVVTHNDTEVDMIQSLTASLSATPSGLVQFMASSPLTMEVLAEGQSAFFWWVYNAIATGTVTFNASYGQAPIGNYALSSVNILSAPSGGGGNVAITGVNGTGVYNPSQWNPLGSTQYVSGSVSDLASNDSSYAVFRSYYSGSATGTDDVVGNNSSDVDGLGNRGTHSNFTAMQYGPDSVYDTLTETSSGITAAYYPSSYNPLGSTQFVSGALGNLQADDGVYMTFRGYQTATSSQALYAHSETTMIGGTSYYLDRLTSADGTAASLSTSMSAVDRQLWGKFVYPLTGVSSIPASTWTMNYRGWRDVESAIAFDAASSVETGTSATSVSWSHTTGSGYNRLLLVAVGVHVATGTPTTVTAVTYGGVSMTQETSALYSTASPRVRAYIFRLTNPASGTNTITVTFAASTLYVCGAATYSGVDQTTPIQTSNTATGSGTSQSVSVTAAGAGRAVFGHLSGHRTASPTSWTITEGSGQNNRWTRTTYLYKGRGSDELNVAAGSVTMSWTTSRTVNWVCSAVVINPVSPTAHCDVDVLIRKADDTVRAIIATNAAASADLTTTATTLSGTYSWLDYSVVDQTDFLEIDYYVSVTASAQGLNAYLSIDDPALAIADQTKATNVMLPSEYMVEVEFLGASNIDTWAQLIWTVDSSFTTSAVGTTFQLYNYTAGAYSTGGDGYMTDSIGIANVTKTQTITVNPTQFRDGSGNWRMKIKGVKATTAQFDWRGDFVEFAVESVNCELDLEAQWTGVDYGQVDEWLCIYGGTTGAENLRVDVWNGSAWNNVIVALANGWNNVSVSSYLTSSNFTVRFKGASETGDIVQDSWNVDVAILHLWTASDQYTAEVEFTGSSNLQTWASLLWQVQSCWDISQITVTIQFYDFTLGSYATSGNGYLNYVSSETPNTNELGSQTVISSPNDFKNSTGYWRVKIRGVKSTSTQFLIKADWIDFETTYSTTGSTIPYNVWQWYDIKATSASGDPLPYAYVTIYANGTSVVFRNATDKAPIANPAWVRLDASGGFQLEIRSASGSAETFIVYAVVGSTLGQKTVVQEAP